MQYRTINGFEGIFLQDLEHQVGVDLAKNFMTWIIGQTVMDVNGQLFFHRVDVERWYNQLF